MGAAPRRIIPVLDGVPIASNPLALARAARLARLRIESGAVMVSPRLNRFADELEASLHPKQRLTFESDATEILFGGAAGPGKSYFLRAAALIWAIRIPGLQAYLFRREYPDLRKNHVEGPKGLLSLLAPLVAEKQARFNLSEHYIAIGKSRIHLCHCQHEKDVYGYQGAEIHLLLPDELTQFTDTMYRYLRGRVRMVGVQLPAEMEGRFPRIVAGSNPGGIGHNFVRETFVSPRPEFETWRAPADEGGMLRQFIPARLDDNPSMAKDDPSYGSRLDGLGRPELVRAMKGGDWDIVEGGAIDDVWRSSVHVVEPFEIPAGWRIDRGFDWGDAKPFDVGWHAESDGTEAILRDGTKRSWPRGTIFQVAEWYGCNGRPNEGLRLVDTEIARRLLAMQKEMAFGPRVQPGPADASIFDVENGQCIADNMARIGVAWTRANKSPGSRKNGLQLIRSRLKAALREIVHEDGRKEFTPRWPMEEQGLFFFNTCRHAIRTIPVLPLAPGGLDVDTEAEDHPYDRIRYRVLAAVREAGSFGLGV